MIGLLVGLLGLVIYLTVLWDGFQVIVLPRSVGGELRLSHPFFRFTWVGYRVLARAVPRPWRDTLLACYGPGSLIVLIGLWALALVVSFALMHWGIGSALNAPERLVDFTTDLYFSGTTFFTLGLGDVTPRTGFARFLTVVEVGTGFAFLAGVIGYLPVLYQAFASREIMVALLAARAGSPPSAVAFLQRFGLAGHASAAGDRLLEGEHWTAQLLGSLLSHAVLGFYRSQHRHHSWVGALTIILDTAALAVVGVQGVPVRAGHLAFDMGCHCAAELCQLYSLTPLPPSPDRLPPAAFVQLRALLAQAGVPLDASDSAEQRLAALRRRYEPYLNALSGYLLMPLPSWLPPDQPPPRGGSQA